MTRKQFIIAVTILMGAGLLLLAPIVCASAIASLNLFDKPDERIPFSVAGWNAPMTDSEGYFTGTRLEMVDDLLNRYDFHGWNVQDVQELLGKPDSKQIKEQGYIIEYDLREGLNLLIFEIDNQHKVVNYRVRIDD